MGAASEGGYLGADSAAFFSAVVSGAAGSYLVRLTEDVGISMDLAIEPGQDVHISGDSSLTAATNWGPGSFVVQERASLSLSNLALGEASTIVFAGISNTVSIKGTILSTECAVALLESLRSHAGASLELNTVTIPLLQQRAPMTGSLTADEQDGLNQDPPAFYPLSTFSVTSGPCTTLHGGRCVGRRYSDQDPWPGTQTGGGEPTAERCEIVVLGGGALAASPLFDTVSYRGYVNRANGNMNFNARHDAVGLGGASCAPANCFDNSGQSCYVTSHPEIPDPVAPPGCYAGAIGPPRGTVLEVGETLTWAAAGDAGNACHAYDGGSGCNTYNGNPSNRASVHGGWELCFA